MSNKKNRVEKRRARRLKETQRQQALTRQPPIIMVEGGRIVTKKPKEK